MSNARSSSGRKSPVYGPLVNIFNTKNRYPEVVDVPEEFQSTMRAEIEDAVGNLKELELWSNNGREFPMIRQLYYFLRTWASSCGLYAENDISCFDANTLQEFTYRTIFDSKLMDCGSTDPFAIVCQFLSQHETCHQSIGEKCPFDVNEANSRLSGTKRWSGEQFRVVHEELRYLHANLLVTRREQLKDNWFYDVLREFQNRPISQTMRFGHNVRITMQYSGQSQHEGTEMMDFVKEKVLELKECAFQLSPCSRSD
jgi:hypothetical protein